jgi:hypothetical protein
MEHPVSRSYGRGCRAANFTVKSKAVMEDLSLTTEQRSDKVASLSALQKRELVNRVLAGRVFNRAPAMRAFLVYITENTLSGQTEHLKEQVIGAEVLGRRPDYNPADDNIVRVRAHELRERLERHFSTEGAEEPIMITVPKGSYVPEFVLRKSPLAEPQQPLQLVPATPADRPAIGPVPAPVPTRVRRWVQPVAFAAILVAAVLLTAVLVARQSKARLGPRNGPVHDFWAQFFSKPDEELRIVFADTSFALWQDTSGKSYSLGSYLSHEYLSGQGGQLREVATRRATSPADLLISVHLTALAGEFGGQVAPQFARNVNAEFLRRGNVVVIGSRRSNPWMELYEPNLNFQLGQDPGSSAPIFHNRAPQKGEADMYVIPAMLDTEGAEQREFTSYGVVALLRGCGSRRFILLAEGLNMQATQAAGEMVTDPQLLESLLRSIGHKPGENVAPFEALIQVTSLPGSYENPHVVAFRTQPSDSCVGS